MTIPYKIKLFGIQWHRLITLEWWTLENALTRFVNRNFAHKQLHRIIERILQGNIRVGEGVGGRFIGVDFSGSSETTPAN